MQNFRSFESISDDLNLSLLSQQPINYLLEFDVVILEVGFSDWLI
jgi:hypothetical protein